MVNKITLTPHQQGVFNSLWKFIEQDTAKGYLSLFTGPAGSGKSTLVIELIRKVLSDAVFNNIAVCATTNKALRVVREMLPNVERTKVTFKTVHSLLGLKHKITNNGKEVFEKDKQNPSKFGLYDVVIVDESSMLSDDLFHEMQDQNYRGVKVIFVGDMNQINPVNHIHAIPMLEEERVKHNICCFALTEIVRQAQDNPIIKTSQEILQNTFQFSIGNKNIVDRKGVAMLNKHQPEVIHNILKYYFCSDNFDNNTNYCKVIAWRNIIVNNFNDMIRGMKYGLNAPKLVVGEKLIADKPIKGETKDQILFNTNDDLVVLNIEIKSKTLYDQNFTYYDAMVEGEDETANIHVLHERSNALYNRTLKTMADDAKNEKDSYQRGQKWLKYYGFIDNFAAVKYAYAITAHNSQGSTYDNAFVVYTDIILNQNIEEQTRIMYTATTRPKEMLYIM